MAHNKHPPPCLHLMARFIAYFYVRTWMCWVLKQIECGCPIHQTSSSSAISFSTREFSSAVPSLYFIPELWRDFRIYACRTRLWSKLILEVMFWNSENRWWTHKHPRIVTGLTMQYKLWRRQAGLYMWQFENLAGTAVPFPCSDLYLLNLDSQCVLYLNPIVQAKHGTVTTVVTQAMSSI